MSNRNEPDMPYERFLNSGPESLTDSELLAIIIRTGTARNKPTDIARKILSSGNLKEHGLRSLYHLSIAELMNMDGIGEVKAVKIKCIAELSRRMAAELTTISLDFNRPDTIAKHYMEQLRHEEREKVLLLSLDTRLSLLSESVISLGTVNESLLSPREVYIEAVRNKAVNIILLHNHPGGNVLPSKADICVTDRIREAGALIGIKLIDHIIIGDNSYMSFSEKKLL